MENRLFFSQAALDRWLSDGSAELRDGKLTLAAGRRFELTEALHVLREVSGAGDPHDLVGRVKGLAHLAGLGADVVETSMLIGDCAYDVERGWVGVAVDPLLGGKASMAQQGNEGSGANVEVGEAGRSGAGSARVSSPAPGDEAKTAILAGEAQEEGEGGRGAGGARSDSALGDAGNGGGPSDEAIGARKAGDSAKGDAGNGGGEARNTGTRKRRTKG